MHPTFEVTITGENRTNDEIILINGIGQGRFKRPRITHTCDTAEADNIEAQCIKILLDAGCLKIVCDYSRPR